MPGIPMALPPLKEVERNHIVKALRHTGWNITRAAEILGISRKTVHEKIKQYGLEREGELAGTGEGGV
jgi:transcriptional regulator of acetoin/glycerol metabolism